MAAAPGLVGDVSTWARGAARRRPVVLVAIGVFLYATGPVMVRASSVSGPVFSMWRLWFGVVVFSVVTVVHVRMSGRRPDRRAWRFAGVTGVVFGVQQLVFMSALKATSVVDVLLVSTLAPIVTGLLAIPLFGERTGATFRLWSVVAIAGSGVVILAGSSGPEGDPVGMALAFANVFAFSGFFLLSKRGRDHIDVVPFLLGVMTVAAFTVTGFVLATGGEAGAMQGGDWALTFAVAVLPGAVGHFVMTWPLRWVPANVPPVMRLGLPVISGLLAWVTLGETINAVHLLGGAVTIGGVAGALLSPSGRRLVAREATAPEAVD